MRLHGGGHLLTTLGIPMNATAHLHRRPVSNSGCGRTAVQNIARYWWQSRHGLADPPELTDLAALARAIRGVIE